MIKVKYTLNDSVHYLLWPQATQTIFFLGRINYLNNFGLSIMCSFVMLRKVVIKNFFIAARTFNFLSIWSFSTLFPTLLYTNVKINKSYCQFVILYSSVKLQVTFYKRTQNFFTVSYYIIVI